MPRKSNSKSAQASKTKPADPTEAEAKAEADKTSDNMQAAVDNGGSNPEPATEESKQAALEEQAKDQGGAKIVSNLEETDAMREAAKQQSEERREAVDGDNLQPSATYAENEPADGAIERDEVEAEVPRPKVFSSADLTNRKVDPSDTEKKLVGMRVPQYREPTATERKLAQQGLIPPYRE